MPGPSEYAELIAEARSWASEPWAHDNWADLMNKLADRLEALAKERDEAAAAERERCGQEILQLLRARKEG